MRSNTQTRPQFRPTATGPATERLGNYQANSREAQRARKIRRELHNHARKAGIDWQAAVPRLVKTATALAAISLDTFLHSRPELDRV